MYILAVVAFLGSLGSVAIQAQRTSVPLPSGVQIPRATTMASCGTRSGVTVAFGSSGLMEWADGANAWESIPGTRGFDMIAGNGRLCWAADSHEGELIEIKGSRIVNARRFTQKSIIGSLSVSNADIATVTLPATNQIAMISKSRLTLFSAPGQEDPDGNADRWRSVPLLLYPRNPHELAPPLQGGDVVGPRLTYHGWLQGAVLAANSVLFFDNFASFRVGVVNTKGGTAATYQAGLPAHQGECVQSAAFVNSYEYIINTNRAIYLLRDDGTLREIFDNQGNAAEACDHAIPRYEPIRVVGDDAYILDRSLRALVHCKIGRAKCSQLPGTFGGEAFTISGDTIYEAVPSIRKMLILPVLGAHNSGRGGGVSAS